jgi:hypothetical protein
MQDVFEKSPRELLIEQRSHLLVVLSQPRPSAESAFRLWYLEECRGAVAGHAAVLHAQQYEQDEVDVTKGGWPRLPYRYLMLVDISVDGAEAAGPLIDLVSLLHSREKSAEASATWLYYPAGEKVGRSARSSPSLLTVAFANGLPGQEGAFREWYATRHIRHALHIDALVSGQCFERTQFQKAGALRAEFSTIAIYEQEGTPEAMLESMASIRPGTMKFPTLDLDRSRFSESIYRPV